MQPRIDINAGSEGEPDRWAHSACILCSNGCGLEIAVKGERIDPKGKAFLKPVHWRRQPNPTTEDYPLMLITGRVVYHFHPQIKTGRSLALNDRVPHADAEIHPEDAEGPGIGQGDQSANQHTWYAGDPVSHQPRLKSSPAKVRRLSFGGPEPWLLNRLAELNGESTEPFAARSIGGSRNMPAP